MKKKSLKKKRQTPLKKWASFLHLWLGLLSGIIVFIIAVTGCIYVFQDEIKDVAYSWRKLTPEDGGFVKPSQILTNLESQFPETEANMVVFQKGDRPASVTTEIDGVSHAIYFNPYSGEITHIENLETEFFMVVENLHRFLLLPEAIGKHVTGVATLIFLVMLVTGLILWWPKKLKQARTHFRIKWRARWRRKNYDWHRATGFYLIFPAIIMAVTGLSFSYEWMHDSLFVIGNLGQQTEGPVQPTVEPTINYTDMTAFDQAFYKTQEFLPESGMFFVWDQGSGLPIITGAYPTSLEFDHQSNFYFHPSTAKLLESQYYDSKSSGLQLQEMNFGLHTGQYFGIFGKIMAFTASFFVALLPVSGFLIWWGKKKKYKKPKISSDK